MSEKRGGVKTDTLGSGFEYFSDFLKLRKSQYSRNFINYVGAFITKNDNCEITLVYEFKLVTKVVKLRNGEKSLRCILKTHPHKKSRNLTVI